MDADAEKTGELTTDGLAGSALVAGIATVVGSGTSWARVELPVTGFASPANHQFQVRLADGIEPALAWGESVNPKATAHQTHRFLTGITNLLFVSNTRSVLGVVLTPLSSASDIGVR